MKLSAKNVLTIAVIAVASYAVAKKLPVVKDLI